MGHARGWFEREREFEMTTAIRHCLGVLAAASCGCRGSGPAVAGLADASITVVDSADVSIDYRNRSSTALLSVSVERALLNNDQLDWSDIAYGFADVGTGGSARIRIGSLSSPDSEGASHVGIRLHLERCSEAYPIAVFARKFVPKRLRVVAKGCIIEEILYE